MLTLFRAKSSAGPGLTLPPSTYGPDSGIIGVLSSSAVTGHSDQYIREGMTKFFFSFLEV